MAKKRDSSVFTWPWLITAWCTPLLVASVVWLFYTIYLRNIQEARANAVELSIRASTEDFKALSKQIKEMILNGASTAELKMEAIRLGMRTLRQSAITKLIAGVTSMEEVARVSASD